MASAYFRKGEFPQVPQGDGRYAQRLLAFGGALMLGEMDFEAGAESRIHAHDEEQMTLCVSGEFETEVGGLPGTLRPGDSFYAGKGVRHGVRCVQAGKLIHAFTPQREGYKQP